MISTLDIKLFRDLTKMWLQVLAIALVLACGVATIIIAVGAYRSLDETKNTLYQRYQFADLFAYVVRAPKSLEKQIARIDGVRAVQTRIVKPALLDISGMDEPASGMVVSIPDRNEPLVNRLHMREGRMPIAGSNIEIALLESFAKAHGFKLGDSLTVIIDGAKRDMRIVGIVLSPEYIYTIGPGDMVPDDRRFGILFLSQKTLSGIFDMGNAFNDLNVLISRNANTNLIIENIDQLLKPFGGRGAYERDDQISNAFLQAGLDQLYAMARVIPPIFLLVAAFLVNMILNRLIALEREQIGLLKALGYSNINVGWHYAKLVIVISLIGITIGSGFGFWAGRGLTQLYASFFWFPFLIFESSIDLYLIAGGISTLSALMGASKAIYSVVALPPAVAMRPPAPTSYNRVGLGGLLNLGIFSRLTVMSLRHLLRWPLRSALTILGTSFAVALMVTSLFTYDSIDKMIDIIYFQTERQNATISLTSDQPANAVHAIERLPGIMVVEPFRRSNVIVKNGVFEQQLGLMGVEDQAELSRVLDEDGKPITVPKNGLLMSSRLLEKLGLKVGDIADVYLKDKADRLVSIPVIGVVQSYVGLTAYIHITKLNHMLRDGNLISGTHVSIDKNEQSVLYQKIKQTPSIASIALLDTARVNLQDTTEENITTMTSVYIILATIITFGVIYNSARIQLSEHGRELASLRIFGFTKREVAGVLLTQMALITLLAQPLGWGLGWLFAWSVVEGFATDLFRIPLVIHQTTYANASVIALIAAFFSALIIKRRVDKLDFISVLKTRE
jgi:putative ABC transport system permease protein